MKFIYIYIWIYIPDTHICVCIYISNFLCFLQVRKAVEAAELPKYIFIFIFIYMCMHICIYIPDVLMCIYTYIYIESSLFVFTGAQGRGGCGAAETKKI